MKYSELKTIIVETIIRHLNESDGGYEKTPNYDPRSYNLQNIAKNPLAQERGNHGGTLDAVRTPSTEDWNGANFKSSDIIHLSDNRLSFYKIKHFQDESKNGSIDFFGKGAIGEKKFRDAIDTIFGAAQRNGKNVLFRSVVSATKPPRTDSLYNTFWEFSLDDGNSWNMVLPNPIQTMKKSTLIKK